MLLTHCGCTGNLRRRKFYVIRIYINYPRGSVSLVGLFTPPPRRAILVWPLLWARFQCGTPCSYNNSRDHQRSHDYQVRECKMTCVSDGGTLVNSNQSLFVIALSLCHRSNFTSWSISRSTDLQPDNRLRLGRLAIIMKPNIDFVGILHRPSRI